MMPLIPAALGTSRIHEDAMGMYFEMVAPIGAWPSMTMMPATKRHTASAFLALKAL